MLRSFGSFLLCLLVFLHRFLLFLGCLGLRFLLFLSRLLSLARTVWAGEDLSFSRHRPCKTTGDQQYESRTSLHNLPGTQEPTADLTRSCVRAPAANPLRNITPVTLKTWLIYEMSSSLAPGPRATRASLGSDEYIAAFYKLTLVPDIEIGVAFLPRRHMSNRIAAYPRVAELSLLPVATLSEFP